MVKFFLIIIIFFSINSCSFLRNCKKDTYVLNENIDLTNKKNFVVNGRYCVNNEGVINSSDNRKARIYGYVVDRLKGKPLEAGITIVGQEKGCFADKNGFFEIELSGGKYSINVAHVGYDKITTRKIDLKDNEVVNINFFLGTTILKQ